MDTEELLKSRGIEYQTKGNDYLVRCLNPEHDDSHPSMRVDKITGIFNCFACGFKGNLFTSFGEDPNWLQLRKELLKKKIQNKYSESIGLSLPKDASKYEGTWRDISPETYKKFDAFLSNSSEHAGRVVFPIRNITGRIVAFIGRHMTGGTPKYVVQPPGAKIPLYPLVEPIQGKVILVEGIFDAINLYDKGLTNAVACFGTNNISVSKLQLLKIQGVDSIHVFFDGDTAGQDGAKKVKSLCNKAGLTSKNIYLENTDPGELTKTKVEKLYNRLYT